MAGIKISEIGLITELENSMELPLVRQANNIKSNYKIYGSAFARSSEILSLTTTLDNLQTSSTNLVYAKLSKSGDTMEGKLLTTFQTTNLNGMVRKDYVDNKHRFAKSWSSRICAN